MKIPRDEYGQAEEGLTPPAFAEKIYAVASLLEAQVDPGGEEYDANRSWLAIATDVVELVLTLGSEDD